jgi:hypothetical protein
MANTTTTIPPAPLSMAGDPSAQTEMMDAYQKILSSLEQRNKINWFNVAGALLTPGRTGSAGEALGNASQAIGKDLDRQQEMQLPIAQMRVQIAQGKYQLQQDAQGLQMLGQILGTSPQDAKQKLETGDISQQELENINPKLFAALAVHSPRIAEILKTTMGLTTEQGKLTETKRANLANENIKGLETKLAFQKFDLDILKAGMDVEAQKRAILELIDKVGMDTVKASGITLPNALKTPTAPTAPTIPSPAAPPAATEPAFPDKASVVVPRPVLSTEKKPAELSSIESNIKKAIDDRNTAFKAGDGKKAANLDKQIGQMTKMRESLLSGSSTTSTTAEPTSKVNIIEPTQVASTEENALPPATRRAIAEARAKSDIAIKEKQATTNIEQTTKDYAEKRAGILAWDPQVTDASNRDLRELSQLVNKKPYLVGLMQKSGTISGLQAAAQEGVSTPWGSFNLPVEKYLTAAKIPEKDKPDAARIAQILARQFFANAKTVKSTLGPQISNSDAALMKAPMVTVSDSAKAITYWAKENVLLNKQRGELFDALHQHDTKRGAAGSPAEFFGSNPYTNIINKYGPLFQYLQTHH